MKPPICKHKCSLNKYDFDRSYEKEFLVTKGDFEDGTTIMHKNARAVISFMRYLVKYGTSFEKLYNMANKDA